MIFFKINGGWWRQVSTLDELLDEAHDTGCRYLRKFVNNPQLVADAEKTDELTRAHLMEPGRVLPARMAAMARQLERGPLCVNKNGGWRPVPDGDDEEFERVVSDTWPHDGPVLRLPDGVLHVSRHMDGSHWYPTLLPQMEGKVPFKFNSVDEAVDCVRTTFPGSFDRVKEAIR